MHTQNVKTAAPESSERWGESKGDFLITVHNLLVKAQRCLKQGYVLSEGNLTRDGDHHVSLYKNGDLLWLGWTFERDFLADLRRYIGEATEDKG